MRLGDNPAKDGKLLPDRIIQHRIIIPLHIPYESGYYKDSYEIFELCLNSIIKTSNSELNISVISNGSCKEVNDKLSILFEKQRITELILEKEAIGKVNSILKALRTTEERLITITDADVLFCNGWENAVIDVFEAFPNSGAVCPIPVFRKHFDLTSNIWLDNLFNDRIRFLPVKDPEALSMFGKSLGWKWLVNEFKDVIGTIKNKNNKIAVLGCSHVVATYKNEVFKGIPNANAKFKLEGICEYEYTDLPVLKRGGYRLSTYDNYAYHLGNVAESWMYEKFNGLYEEKKVDKNIETLKFLRKSYFYSYKEKIFKKLLSFDKLKRKILKIKGLNKEQIYNFLDKKYI